MVDCNKQQKEVYKGTQQIRCIHPEAETYKEIVPPAVCEGCPLAGLVKKKCESKHPNYQPKKPEQQKSQLPQLPVLDLQPGYPECPFRYNRAKDTLCSITNLRVDPEICNRCDADTREHSASFGEKVTNYFGAIRRWAANGRPTRTKEEIERLFNEHCKGCERYDAKKHACKSCGCAVSTDSSPLGNKLAMATESCPLGRF